MFSERGIIQCSVLPFLSSTGEQIIMQKPKWIRCWALTGGRSAVSSVRACPHSIPAKIIQVGAVCAMQWWYRIIDYYFLFRQRRHHHHSVQFVALIDKWLFRTVPSRQSRKIRSLDGWLDRSFFRCFSAAYVHRSRSRSRSSQVDGDSVYLGLLIVQ